MQKEKLAAVLLAVIIIGALFAFLVIEYKDEIFENLSGGKEVKPISFGDCADVDFTAYFSNETVFATSYRDVAKEWDLYDEEHDADYQPMKVFVTLQWNNTVPEGYENYSTIPIDGFIEGLVGLEEGKEYTIGPIPPEKAFGVKLDVGDIIDITIDEEYAVYGIPDMHVQFIDIIENVSVNMVSEDYLIYVSGDTTTLYVAKDISQKLGDIRTDYTCWENATVATKVNDTHIWWETSPPADKLVNFTWKEDPGYGYVISYWENASTAVIDETANTIVVTHTPKINQTFDMTNEYFSLTYSVVSYNDTIINCSYIDFDDNISYMEFDRVKTITKNQSFSLIYNYPMEYIAYYLPSYRLLDPSIDYAVGPSADQIIYFDVDIVKVYNLS